MKKMGFAAVVAFTLSSLAWAQEKPAQRPSNDPATTPDEQEETRSEPRKHIQVLQNPYDISSFYRSSQGSYGTSFGSAPVDPRYPIAGYYRSRQSRPAPLAAPMIWNSYGAFGPGIRGQQLPGRTFLRPGELFLFAPTFLAPFGPFTGPRGGR